MVTKGKKSTEDQLVLSTKELSLPTPPKIGLRESDRSAIRETFLRLDHLVQTEDTPWEDVLLLLTTCRNTSYAMDAMYAEALKWCAEVEGSSGFSVALDRLNAGVSGVEPIDKAAIKAAAVLRVTANFLSEMLKKHDLFFDKFEETRQQLVQYGSKIGDPVARKQFLLKFAEIGSGPGHDEDRLLPPDDSAADIYLERLKEWFALTRPLTGLARTYISAVLGAGSPHPSGKTCKEYLTQIRGALVYWEARGFRCPALPDNDVFERPGINDGDFRQVQKDRLRQFVAFCTEILKIARLFLKEKLPADAKPNGIGYRLKRVPAAYTIDIRGHQFELKRDMFLLITDMRNSTGEPCRTHELKVIVEDVIEHLRNESTAKSQTLYDDCRVIATEKLDDAISCIRRLHEALEPLRRPGGFDGIRVGFTRGEMLFDLHIADAWASIEKYARAPLDSAENTIARAVRIPVESATDSGVISAG